MGGWHWYHNFDFLPGFLGSQFRRDPRFGLRGRHFVLEAFHRQLTNSIVLSETAETGETDNFTFLPLILRRSLRVRWTLGVLGVSSTGEPRFPFCGVDLLLSLDLDLSPDLVGVAG